MKVKLRIPASFFADILGQLKDAGLAGKGCIGQIHLAGDHNEWGGSTDSPGCIKPKAETKMTLEGDFYVITVDVTEGMHQCKPVVVTAKADGDGFTAVDWIGCPAEGVGQFTRASRHDNWQFVAKPTD